MLILIYVNVNTCESKGKISMAGHPPSQPLGALAPKSRITQVMKKVGAFVLASWAFIPTIFFGVICLAAVSAPILSYLGLDDLAKPLFSALHILCAQIPSHSFSIEGHQVGLCVHCLAIYSSLFAGGLFFALSKKRLRGIPWWVFVLLALPLAYDGFSQLFGLRESTWEIRLLTGTLFGLGAAWFTFPLLQKGLAETISSPAA